MGTLSGLYGVRRPLDWMRPYRLEMGTKGLGAIAQGQHPVHLLGQPHCPVPERSGWTPRAMRPARWWCNLASQEYFKSVNCKTLRAPVVECVFEDFKGGKYKIIQLLRQTRTGLHGELGHRHPRRTGLNNCRALT